MRKKFSFKGKTALVTGGGAGIGRLLALALAERGCDVVVSDLNVEAARTVADEVWSFGRRGLAHAVDVASPESVQNLKRFADAHTRGIDVLVNNAGVVFGGAFEQVPLEHHLQTYRVNIQGVVTVTHAFFTDLLRSPEAHILNIASASGFIGLPNATTYASSKWAAIGFSESIRLELAQRKARNVSVTTACPGYIATGMFNGARAPRLLPLLTPGRIVAKMMRAMERKAPFVREPFSVRNIDLMRGVLPQKGFDLTMQLLGVSSSMRAWTGHAPANSNGVAANPNDGRGGREAA